MAMAELHECLSLKVFQLLLFPIPIKHIERIKWNDPPIGMNDMHAALFDAADVQIVGVHEFHDDDAEDVLVADLVGDIDQGQAAEELLKRERGAGGGMA